MQLNGTALSFKYNNGPWIIKDLSISIKSGEIVGISGPSGCGKTTLAKILAGYELPQNGGLTIDDRAIPKRGFNPVQLVFQHPERAVNFKWKLSKILQESWDVEETILQSLGIEPDWLDRWPNELSGGELQRFCVARALNPKTKFLIADEMTTMLDAITQAQLWNFILDTAKKRNMGLIVMSHEETLLNRLCTRIIDINEL